MSDQDIFSQNDKSSEGNPDQNKQDLFTEMVGEDKRYKSPQELAKGKQEADEFIEKLKEETAQLRDELNKRLTAEEILEQVKASSSKGDSENQGISAEDIAKLVQGTVKDIDSQKSAQANLDKSTELMVNKYGDKAGEMIVNKARELGITPQSLQQTASESPKAFAQLMGLDQSPNNQSGGMEGTINTQALESQNGSHSGPQEGTYAWYEQMRKQNPRQYFSPQVQNEMFAKRKQLGDKFYS